MFNQKVLKERIGPLKKNKALNEIEQVEGYVIRKCSEHGIETSYDVLAEEMPYFKTLAYTEFATSFYMQPLNNRLSAFPHPGMYRMSLSSILTHQKSNPYLHVL